MGAKKPVRTLDEQHAESSWAVADAAQDNALAAVTKAGEVNVTHYIDTIFAGYDTTEIVGELVVRDGGSEGSGGTVILRTYVHEAGVIPLAKPLKITTGNPFFVELAASGTGGQNGVVSAAGHSI